MVYKRRKFVLWGGIRGGERERATDVDVNSGCCEPSFFFLLISMLSDVMLAYLTPYLLRMSDIIHIICNRTLYYPRRGQESGELLE